MVICRSVSRELSDRQNLTPQTWYRHSPLIGETPQHAHNLIDEETQDVIGMLNTFSDECQRVLYTLRSRRNASTALHLLAAEPPLLLTIFQLASDYGRDFRTFLHISHTCTFWRKMCLETGSFYQSIDLSSLPIRVAELFADRAQSPFSLHFERRRYRTPNSLDWLALVTSFIDARSLNMREMELSFSSTPWLTAILSPALHLEKLALILPLQALHIDPLIGELFGGETPKLRELSIAGLYLHWSAKAYRGLKKLTINLAHHPDSLARHESGKGILEVFQSSSRLKELTLRYPPFMFNGEHPLDPVALPHLRRIDLDLEPSDAHKLLSAIVSPPSQTLRVKVSSVPSVAPARAAVSIIPTDHRCSQCIGALVNLELDLRGLIIRGWEPASSQCHVEISSDSLGDLISTFRNIFAFVLTPNLKLIRVINDPRESHLTSDNLIRALRLSSDITSLELEGYASSILNNLTTQISYS